MSQTNRRAAGFTPAPSARGLPLVVAAAHGGAGATTLARLIGARWDVGTAIPGQVGPVALLIVARSTAAGARALLSAADWARSAGWRPAVAVVADSTLPTPAAVRARLRMLSPHVPVVYRIGYVPRWREIDDPLADARRRGIPRQLRRTLAAIQRDISPR